MPFSLDSMPIASHPTENAYLFCPELIELIEQEGATRFFGKKWGSFGACGEGIASIPSNPTEANGRLLGS
jgi:hypothetical protein